MRLNARMKFRKVFEIVCESAQDRCCQWGSPQRANVLPAETSFFQMGTHEVPTELTEAPSVGFVSAVPVGM